VTCINAGLPVLFVSSESLGIPFKTLTSPPDILDTNNEIMSLLETLRIRSAKQFPGFSQLSASVPKICLVSPFMGGYITTGGETLEPLSQSGPPKEGTRGQEEVGDVVLRAISVGNVHRTIPATVLMAAAAAGAVPGTVVHEARQKTREFRKKHLMDFQVQEGENVKSELQWLTAAHPAGYATAGSRVSRNQETDDGEKGAWKIESVAMMRTARKIMVCFSLLLTIYGILSPLYSK
jgi:2-methylaconitate cis-trans-isomerase PrpF